MRPILNADLGESWYDHHVGDDAGVMPHLDACNIACGFHGGDALTILRTIDLAVRHGVAVGAHPSFPDRKNFGRVAQTLAPDALYAMLLYQISAVAGMVRTLTGARLHHVKAHGALYHYVDREADAARTLVRVVSELDVPILFGPPGGALAEAARAHRIDYFAEGFVDRRYEPSLLLRARTEADACIADVAEACEQARLLTTGQVRATDGKLYPLAVRTLCIHGDHTGAATRARAVRETLEAIPPR
ncbi:5-oxoprolinase subunit PxpA [Lewinella sp. JB7]|uniref:5-oxoprolinase subunit PxpA n=1 Tax=Lewinella sp. JB7 TaxID=2962887 RepID=UPI0020C9C310|nr:5-oxoprolinase subunit PxpA [Lewinella sp. JB7]MCP9237272.1 LamB/YcsF family protein [Lewinella sp. JB7]